MTPRFRFLLLVFSVLCLVWVLRHFAGSFWRPVIDEMSGKKTVASVLEAIRGRGLGLSAEEGDWVRSLTLVALKDERRLEVWGHREDGTCRQIRGYPFTGFSGELGPKLREGDGQIPEGLYRVEYLNPNSSYHLSIKIDYPNAFDREKGAGDGREQLGFDIFIHGKSVTVGCIPIGDDAIEDLFGIVSDVGIGKVIVIISPWDFRVRETDPEIPGIEWESELYLSIRKALGSFIPDPPG